MPRKILVIYSIASTVVATTSEYVRSFGKYSRNDISYINGTDGAALGVGLSDFDAVWLNYCCRLCFPGYVGRGVREALKAYRGLKLMSVQDEYDRTETLRQGIEDLGFDAVFTCVPQTSLSYVYPRDRFPSTEFITVLTGYVPEHLERRSGATPLERRPIVVGYRGRDIGPRYGELGFWKAEIGRRMKAICLDRGIRCDIEVTEESRLHGESWYGFVESCRTMLGSESGSNVFDFDGSLEQQYEQLKRTNPSLSYEEFKPQLMERERDIGMGQISPRVFEAAALHTPMILLTGSYSGLIRPGEHYVELRKDFLNVDDVLRQAQDFTALGAMADRAYQHLIASGAHSYRRFVELVDEVIERKLSETDNGFAAVPARPNVGGTDATALHQEGPMITEFPTPYPLDFSYLLRRQMNRLPASAAASGLRDASAAELASELARRMVAAPLGWRWARLAARLKDDRDVFAKVRTSARAITAYPLRPLFLAGLADREIRSRIGYERLITDLLKLEIIRRARGRKLRSAESFSISWKFEPGDGGLTIRSVPASSGRLKENDSESVSEVFSALSKRQVTSILWDHSALGWHVRWELKPSQWMTVFVGVDGVHRFDALVELARRRPQRVAGTLVSILAGQETHEMRQPPISDSVRHGEKR